ncbi:MAG: MYG1 family protein [Candidatus Pacebacteria bacterium]|nr:MYG1 family protein [Candidatus Paceibacterota bacterium]
MDKETVIVTHSGSFHTDDVFAVATIKLFLGDVPCRIVRTRDMEIIKKGDFVVDVGNVYDSEKNCFDHHQQEGGAGARDNGIPYSSFGLVWKKFGEKLCESKEVANIIEKRLVYPIDASDNGVETYIKSSEELTPYTVHNIIGIFYPTQKEEEKGQNFDTAFTEALEIAQKILSREIQLARDKKDGEVFVEKAYDEAEDKRIIVIDGRYPWETVLSHYPEPLYVVSPDSQGDNFWKVKAVREDPEASFKNRKDLPKSWAGKRNEELAKVTGVSDATFCHNKCFIAVAGSKEGALNLAKLAINSK